MWEDMLYIITLIKASRQPPPQSSLSQPPPAAAATSRGRVIRTGIGGIERSLEAKAKATDTQITKAFQDLDQLMAVSKPMVKLAKNISGKIRVRCIIFRNWMDFPASFPILFGPLAAKEFGRFTFMSVGIAPKSKHLSTG